MIFKKNFFRLFAIGVTLLLFVHTGYAQNPDLSNTPPMDSIFFLNGEIKAVRLIDTANNIVRFSYPKKNNRFKLQEVELGTVFSLKYSNGMERILYFNDSLIGNVLTVLEAKMFMLGEREAEQHYKNKFPFIIGMTTGLISPLILSNALILSPIAPAIVPIHTYLPHIHINTKKMANKNYLQYDTYLMGYEKTARKKNFITSLLGAGIGLVTGIGVWAVIK